MCASPFSCPSCGEVQTPGTAICTVCHVSLSVSAAVSGTDEASPRPWSSASPVVTGSLVHGRYRLVTILRETSGGALYVAEDTELGNRRVVIKEVRFPEGSAEDRQKAARTFQQEALLLGGLRHVSLPGIYEQFSDGGHEYLVREYIEGQTLAEYVDHVPGGRLSLQATADLGIRLAEALGYLHTCQPQVILGNLSPSHVLLTPDEQVFLIDVSLARQVTPGKPQPAQTPGLARYAAPEQLQGLLSQESDQYALALMLAELLTGRRVSSGPVGKPDGDQLVTSTLFFSGTAHSPWPAVEGVLRKALSPNPQDRYPTIRAFADALLQASRSSSVRLPLGPAAAPWPGMQPTQPALLSPLQAPANPQRSKPLLIVALVITLLVGTVACGFGIFRLSQAAITSAVPLQVTPTATPNLNVYYLTQVPGPGCDTNGGIWQAADSSTQVSCSPSGLKISQPANAPYIAEVYFNGPQSDYTFPQNYTISVEVSHLESQDTCAGVSTREQADGAGGYSFLVCGDGVWVIYEYDNATGNASQLSSGMVKSASSYVIQVTGKDALQHFSVNGTNEVDLNDRTYLSTSSLGLIVDTGPTAAGGSAVFSTFVYTSRPQ